MELFIEWCAIGIKVQHANALPVRLCYWPDCEWWMCTWQMNEHRGSGLKYSRL